MSVVAQKEAFQVRITIGTRQIVHRFEISEEQSHISHAHY